MRAMVIGWVPQGGGGAGSAGTVASPAGASTAAEVSPAGFVSSVVIEPWASAAGLDRPTLKHPTSRMRENRTRIGTRQC